MTAFRLVPLALSLLLVPLTARADEPTGKLPDVRARMQAFVDQGEIAGAVTVVGHRDGVVSLDTVGDQDLDARKPMARDTLFRIASMTKPITAIGIMILADEGKLSVDDPVAKHLPEFRGQQLVTGRNGDAVTLAEPRRPVLIRDLLTHTSGIPGRMPSGFGDLYTKRDRTLAEAVTAFAKQPLETEPGTKWAYCNPGIDTLGRIIEVVSGDSYEGFLKKRVFDPLGMADTTFYPTEAQRARLAVLYGKPAGKLAPAATAVIGVPPAARYPIPAGGLCSTGPDLAKLYQMMLNRGTLGPARVLSPAAVETMTKLQTGDIPTGFTPGNGWGFGWCVVRSPQGVSEMLSPGSYGHGGAFGTQAWLDPQKDLFLVLLIQRTGLPNSDASPMRRDFQAAAVAALKK
jgi:CubicO group peptidase (beta-lactamase class C family)